MKKNDYVDNDKLLQNIIEWQQRLKSNPYTPLTDSIGKDIIAISENLVKRWNFSGYTRDWKELMVGDGIEVSLKAVRKFDTENFKNPHAYLTQVCFRAFQNRIKREKRSSTVKYKYFVEEVFDFANDEMLTTVDIDFYHDMVNKVAEYEIDHKKKAKVEESIEDDLPLVGLCKIYGKTF